MQIKREFQIKQIADPAYSLGFDHHRWWCHRAGCSRGRGFPGIQNFIAGTIRFCKRNFQPEYKTRTWWCSLSCAGKYRSGK